MKLLLGLLVILPTVFFAQQTSTIKGKISDNSSDQPIVGAKINIQNKYRAFSNSEGFYELVNVPFGEYVMIVTMSTYDTVKVKLTINKSLVQRDVDLGGSVEFAEIEVICNMVRVILLHSD